ncbi:MAG TPA: toll/interleukin-1 receptor domain-containing protein [Accumulibacter sp.]|nr:toll/interleukin-1 receptor domain-containing protein [Accumulibacter sp.]HND80362.1 toll/interleukin-1 receptor domain-containing protein [Accumulibacter sp.]HNL15300.1 toll/interleukin-1 receptor domain-containing protein [Accumulibacter sp.]
MVSVYVSYAWKEEEQNRLVDKLEQACPARGITLQRDKRRIGYGDSIHQFMNEIGAAGHVVLVLSEAYFTSDYCMYELRRIYEKGDFGKRVSPIVLKGARFHKPIDRIRYLTHWEKEIADLEKALAGLADPKNTQHIRSDLDGYAECLRLLDKLLDLLADMNTLT